MIWRRKRIQKGRGLKSLAATWPTAEKTFGLELRPRMRTIDTQLRTIGQKWVGLWNLPTDTKAQMKFAEDICGRSGSITLFSKCTASVFKMYLRILRRKWNLRKIFVGGREVSRCLRNVPRRFLECTYGYKEANETCGRYLWKVGKYHVVSEMYRVGFSNVPSDTKAQMKFAEDACWRSGSITLFLKYTTSVLKCIYGY